MLEKINGFSMTDEESKISYFVEIESNRIIVESDSSLGRKVLFNEPCSRFASIADLTNELHEQGLEDLEVAIWEVFGD